MKRLQTRLISILSCAIVILFSITVFADHGSIDNEHNSQYSESNTIPSGVSGYCNNEYGGTTHLEHKSNLGGTPNDSVESDWTESCIVPIIRDLSATQFGSIEWSYELIDSYLIGGEGPWEYNFHIDYLTNGGYWYPLQHSMWTDMGKYPEDIFMMKMMRINIFLIR